MAALRLPGDVAGVRLRRRPSFGNGRLPGTLVGSGTTLVVATDMRDGLPTSGDEAAGGDAGAASLVGKGEDTEALAQLVAVASASDEFTDRWRAPGERTSKLWEERFGENRYVSVGRDALARSLKRRASRTATSASWWSTGMHGRAVSALTKKLGLPEGVLADDLSATVGQSGTAHPLLVLAAALESMAAQRVHRARSSWPSTWPTAPTRWCSARPQRSRSGTLPGPWPTRWPVGHPLPTPSSSAWRGQLRPEPPRRPEPSRVSSSAAHRSEEWKFGFVGSKDRIRARSTCPRRASRW